MNNDTEMDASQMVSEGFADEIVKVNNAPRLKNGIERAQIVNITSNVDYDIINEKSPESGDKINKMKKVAGILNLNPDASEDSIRAEVQKIIDARKDAENKVEKLTAERDDYKTKHDTLNKSIKEKEEQEITDYVDKLIELDATKKEQKESLLNMAKQDFGTFKSIMPLKKKVVDGGNIGDEIEEESSQEAKTQLENNAKEFKNMSPEKKRELKNSDAAKYAKLAADYDKFYLETK